MKRSCKPARKELQTGKGGGCRSQGSCGCCGCYARLCPPVRIGGPSGMRRSELRPPMRVGGTRCRCSGRGGPGARLPPRARGPGGAAAGRVCRDGKPEKKMSFHMRVERRCRALIYRAIGRALTRSFHEGSANYVPHPRPKKFGD